MGEDYKRYYALQTSTTLQNCWFSWPSDQVKYIYNEVPGLDTLDVYGGNFAYRTEIRRMLKEPSYISAGGIWYPNHRNDSICEISLGYNSDTMSRQGWSLELNTPLIKDSAYTLQFSIRSARTSVEYSEKFHIRNLNPRAKFRIVVTQSNDRNEPGEELCRLDRFDIVGKDTFPFGDLARDSLDVYYKIRKNIVGKNNGKFITLRIYHNIKEDTFFRSYINFLEPNCYNYSNNQTKVFATSFILESPVKILGDTALCNTSSGNILTASSNHSTDKYLWSTGETTSSIRVTMPGIYWLKKDRNGSLGYDTIEIKLAPSYQAINIDTSFCSRNLVTLGDSVSGASEYFWNSGQSTNSIKPTRSGKYLRTLSMGGCLFTDTFNVEVKPSHLAISSSVFNICKDSSITLKSLISPASWYVDGILKSSSSEYDIISSEAQDIVLFTKKDCEQFDTVRIIPMYCGLTSTIYIPNAFTPNNMGLNDTFYYVGEGWELQSMKIYNRWGQKIFDSPVAWNGEESPEGVYVYVMQFKHVQTNNNRFIKGVLHLLR
ncbi:MAG: gliding motility-associated C-terminal domain-containing protein [Bacteroidia bacterium]|nr:gliding motility-associated C-terminal domain-containing protein [Bacteroidia bacterium]